MSASTALGAVSRSLRKLLLGEMSPQVPVTVLRPDEPDVDKRVNLFLHRVEEHPQLRNAGYQLKAGTTGTLVAPPLSLTLRYLVTAFAKPQAETGHDVAQGILGEAMRVFHQFPVIPADHLDDLLVDAREELRIMSIPLGTDEIGHLWGTLKEPYLLSAQYEVSVVQLDATTAAERPLAPRVRRTAVGEIRAPYEPPRILDLQPRSGPPGTQVTITGEQLAGWRAGVTIDGTDLATGVELDSDMFRVTVPSGRPPGFHQVRVDVARLARASFFFEVT
jgi:hypothetical protein